ncbi:MAG: ribonuclease HI [Candidatus Shikimatogenerans bostrichidophilus]|nr:MAG: ribonuclease HI [Candidatus Shikimatogenerans bostrichidophilus]
MNIIYNIKKYNKLYINIYTDGSSKGNPGPGGCGIIIISNFFYKEFSYGFRYTTNNRMELYSIIYAIKNINNYLIFNINLFSDSKYVIDNINNNRIKKWEKKKFKNIKNNDLWIKFLKIKQNINFFWIKGHNKNFYNEKCNILAQKAINKNNILIDYYYENNK